MLSKLKCLWAAAVLKVKNYGFLRRCRELREEFNEAMLIAHQQRFDREERRRAALRADNGEQQ